MEYVPFGKTGEMVSVAGLGCGGSSKLGASRGKNEDHSIGLILRAFDQGVTLFDTAQVYGTEPIVGKAVAQLPRDQVIISTKMKATRGRDVLSGAEIIAALDRSLAALKTDYIDVFHLHSLDIADYDRVVEHVVPVLLREKEKGKLRLLGCTESGPNDPRHLMLSRAVPNGPFETIALAYNMMNQTGHKAILPQARENGIPSMVMFAVRAVFSIPGRLKRDVDARVAKGELPVWMGETDSPLDFLLHEGGAENIIDAAYRYVRHKDYTDVVLFGTGNPDHMDANIQSILRPPLPQADIDKLEDLFSELVGFGADLPEPQTS
jgi:aryl-alcohol dehydrogenase-like predicted oxidoreductase